MAGEIDVYQVCPCGSGKKLKFCCHAILGDMQRVAEMQAHHQYQMALTALEGLEKKNLKEVWSRAWVKSTKALILSALDKPEEARQAAQDVLEELPDHPQAAVINALLTLTAEGYPAAKRAVYDAFHVQTGGNAFLTSHLARTLAAFMAAQGHILAAREHLALAVSIDSENEQVVEEFLRFEADAAIAYPLRSHYTLSPFAGDESLRPHYEQATELAAMGCFSDAAKAFGPIARQASDQPWVWRNMALCHSWAAEEPLAVEAFKAAAAHERDPEAAADCLLLSRLLQKPSDASRVERVGQQFRIESVSRMLTQLDEAPRFARMPRPPDEEENESLLVGQYQILDRDPVPLAADQLTVDSVPRVVGQIDVFDAAPAPAPSEPTDSTPQDRSPRAIVGCLGREKLESLTQQFTAVAGATAEPMGEPIVAGIMRAELAPLIFPWHLPDDLPGAKAEELVKARWDKVLGEIWPEVPQEALGGKTPAQAAQVPELGNALRAAVLALDIFAEQAGHMLDVDAVRTRLGLPAVPSLDFAPDDDPIRFSILQVRRLPLDRLTDQQLVPVANRITRFGHTGLSYRAIQALLTRPEIVAKTDVARLYMTLADLCRRNDRTDEALEWIAKGKQASRERKDPLETLAMWELEELALRSNRPEDPQIANLASTLWNYYRPKLPELANMIVPLLQGLDLPGPWNAPEGAALAGVAEPLAAAGASAGGIWTPAAEPAGHPSKLWLPGQ